jgi:catechol 2,3-dioxygenase
MRIESLGHVVLKVRDIERSAAFYSDVLGFREVGRTPSGNMVFFSIAENHHDLALQKTDETAPSAPANAPGLAHVAWKLGTTLEALREARDWLEGHGVQVRATFDHRVTQSLYFDDPDGNRLEVFVESDPSVWRNDPATVASGTPLVL